MISMTSPIRIFRLKSLYLVDVTMPPDGLGVRLEIGHDGGDGPDEGQAEMNEVVDRVVRRDGSSRMMLPQADCSALSPTYPAYPERGTGRPSREPWPSPRP